MTIMLMDDHGTPWNHEHSRGVAQPGSALAWGARGRGFKSRRPDQVVKMVKARSSAGC
jgi:hypothetical protein